MFTNFFNNYGIMGHKFTEQELDPIYKEVNKLESNFNLYTDRKHNSELAGNIEREFRLVDSVEHLEKLTTPIIHEYNNQFNLTGNSYKVLEKDCKIRMVSSWVNFQRKTEFNPNHIHGGLFSFVLWLKVPYLIQEEQSHAHVFNSRKPCAGHFEFMYTNILGDVCSNIIPVDMTWTGTMLVFPARLNHCVYPFYTSDDFRISVSGNYSFDI